MPNLFLENSNLRDRGNLRLWALRILSCSSLISLGLTGCTEPESDGDPVQLRDEEVEASAVADFDAPSPLSEACWAVGVLPPPSPWCDHPAYCDAFPTCPDDLGPDWQRHGTRMFVDGSQSLAIAGQPLEDIPADLLRFCLYRFSGDSVATSLPQGQFESVAIDCPAAQPLGSTGIDTSMRNAFLAHAGALREDAEPGYAPVSVAVVDAASPWGAPSNTHAEAMTGIIDTLACPSPAGCGVKTYPALALPLRDDGTLADPEGGDYGTRAHVALGIMEAVAGWRQRIANGEQPSRLVLNLSLGWIAEAGKCGSSEAAPWCDQSHIFDFADYLQTPWAKSYATQEAIEAVHGALLYASCNGALIVAAAGNAREDSCNADPVAPAVWSRYHAPNLDECHVLGFLPPPQLEGLVSFNDEPTPLVVPVAGVRHDDEPIAVTRPKTLTRLVASGYHGTIAAGLEALTGTSVSAAVVSSAAALLWTHEPSLSRASVLELLYWTGFSAPTFSELPEFPSLSPEPVQRVSLCRAVGALYGAGDAFCSAHEKEEAYQLAKEAVAIDESLEGVVPTYDVDSVPLVEDACTACGTNVSAFLADPTVSEPDHFFGSCAVSPTSFVFDSRYPLAGPQPEVPVCPDCPVILTSSGNVSAVLSINSAYKTSSLTWLGATLTLERTTGQRLIYDVDALVPLSVLRSSTSVKLNLGNLGTNIRRGTLGMSFSSGGRAWYRSNELLLTRAP